MTGGGSMDMKQQRFGIEIELTGIAQEAWGRDRSRPSLAPSPTMKELNYDTYVAL